jgi:hypothetical protein
MYITCTLHENKILLADQLRWESSYQLSFFVTNTFQIQPFHKGLAKQADVAFCIMPGA